MAGRPRPAEAASTHRDVITGVLGGQPNVRCTMTGDVDVLAHVVAGR